MRELVLSQKASAGIKRIANGIGERFSVERARVFEAEIVDALQALLDFPESYPLHAKGVRKRVFQKRTIILYRVSGEIVYIEAVLDARSNWAGRAE